MCPPPLPAPMTADPRSFSFSHYSTLRSHNSSKVPVKCASKFIASAISAPGEQFWSLTLWMSLSLQISGWQFALQLQFSLMDPRKVIDFQFVSLFHGSSEVWSLSSLHFKAKAGRIQLPLTYHYYPPPSFFFFSKIIRMKSRELT